MWESGFTYKWECSIIIIGLLVFYQTPVYLGSDLCVHPRPCADLTDVTLADKDANSIPADTANWAIQGNVAMQVMQPGGQIFN